MDKSLHVFVCSTYRDLVSERNAVLVGLEGLADQFSSLSYHCPRSIQPLEASKEEIGRSDVLIFIIGHLQGVIAPGLDRSHGEAEYAEAIALGKPVFVYVRDPESGLYPAHFERDAARAAQLKAFRENVEARHGAKTFDDIYSLVSLVTQDLFKLAQDSGLKPKTGPKTVKFKARSWETRKLPIARSPQPPAPEQQESQTRTIPILQKALATPFRRRRPGGGHLARTFAIGAAALALLGLAAAKLKGNLFLISAPPIAAGQQSAPAAASQGIPVAALPASPASAPVRPPEPPPPKPSGIVAVTDDDDPTKAFLRKATQGSPEDQFLAGQMYETGKDVPRNDSLAFRWYKKAADQGLADAQYKVALLYRFGKGTVKSAYQAARWFQSAAEQGHPRAQVKLGQMYKSGKGVPKDDMAAFKWFLKAADQKDPDAEKILAELREN